MTHHCELISGTFSILVQIALGCIALTALLIKRRFFENPKRPKIVWIIDTFKQITGQLFAHALNIGIAYILSQKTSGTGDNDECEWYLLNYLFDTILGVGICYVFVRIQNYISSKCILPRIRSGNYMIYRTDYLSSQQMCKIVGQCLLQIFLWLCVIFLTKTLIFCLILLPLHDYLQQMGDVMVRPLIDHPEVELMVVMIIVPLILNVCQFWIQDLFLKDNQTENQGLLDVDFAELNNNIMDHEDQHDSQHNNGAPGKPAQDTRSSYLPPEVFTRTDSGKDTYELTTTVGSNRSPESPESYDKISDDHQIRIGEETG